MPFSVLVQPCGQPRPVFGQRFVSNLGVTVVNSADQAGAKEGFHEVVVGQRPTRNSKPDRVVVVSNEAKEQALHPRLVSRSQSVPDLLGRGGQRAPRCHRIAGMPRPSSGSPRPAATSRLEHAREVAAIRAAPGSR